MNASALQATELLRERIETAIEGLIDLLDTIEDDPDLEPDGDEDDDPGDLAEPWIGAHEATNQSRGWETGECNRLFDQHDCEADDTDSELTAPERHGMGFATCGPDDAEEDDPGGGDILDEPHDPEDERAADLDALELLNDEIAYELALHHAAPSRRRAHEETRERLRAITGGIRRLEPSYWPHTYCDELRKAGHRWGADGNGAGPQATSSPKPDSRHNVSDY